MERQKNITYWLRAVAIILAVLGAVFFSGITVYGFMGEATQVSEFIKNTVVFIWITAFLCYAILFEFWRVIVEIGNDNSFSLENSKSFKKMALFSVCISGQYLIRMGCLLIVKNINIYSAAYMVAMLILAFLFAVICMALSMLIKNAYEIKLENELTI